MKALDWLHGSQVHPRRVQALRRLLLDLLPDQGTLLDVGCGDGLLSEQIAVARPGLQVSGIDVLVRGDARIPVAKFDGQTIPLEDNSVDHVLFVDVLHHTDDPFVLLQEAQRVSRHEILIKDHTRNGVLAASTLRFMDWVGNARHGVALPYNYWSQEQWEHAFEELELTIRDWISELHLYPAPADWVFGRSLHFITRLSVSA